MVGRYVMLMQGNKHIKFIVFFVIIKYSRTHLPLFYCINDYGRRLINFPVFQFFSIFYLSLLSYIQPYIHTIAV